MSSDQWGSFLPFVLIALAFWFLVIRPARKRQQELQRTQSSVQIGSEVMLSSGIYGRVSALADDSLSLEVSPGTTMKVARQAVARVVPEVAPGTQDLGAQELGSSPMTAERPDGHDER